MGSERIWVAEANDEVVGLTGLIIDDREAGMHTAEVEPLVVASAYQGKGIGRALLTRVVEEAKRLGVRYLSVKPVARNEEAISLFHDFGFRTLGRIEMFMKLQPSTPGLWRSGLKLFGHTFKY